MLALLSSFGPYCLLYCRNTLRITKSSQLESVDPKAKTNNILVGNSNDEFDFELLKVEFAECNGFGKDEAANIDELKKWLLKVA